MKYRQLFMEHYGIKDPGPEFDVHHIDFNRENNDIHNLILLPRSLHRRYHMCVTAFHGARGMDIVIDPKIGSEDISSDYKLSMLRRFLDVAEEVKVWADRKEQMDFSKWMESEDS